MSSTRIIIQATISSCILFQVRPPSNLIDDGTTNFGQCWAEAPVSSSIGRGTDYAKCLICQTTAPELGGLSKLSSRGLPRLKEAIQVRQDDLFTRIWSDMEEETNFLEKKPVVRSMCHSNYTRKKHLEPILAKRTEGCDSSAGDVSASSSFQLRSVSASGSTMADKSIEYNKSV